MASGLLCHPGFRRVRSTTPFFIMAHFRARPTTKLAIIRFRGTISSFISFLSCLVFLLSSSFPFCPFYPFCATSSPRAFLQVCSAFLTSSAALLTAALLLVTSQAARFARFLYPLIALLRLDHFNNLLRCSRSPRSHR